MYSAKKTISRKTFTSGPIHLVAFKSGL